MTAPTEQEIRQAILAELGDHTIDPDDFAGLVDVFRPILDSDMALTRAGWVEDFYPGTEHPGTLWADMTEAEANELHDAMHAVRRRVLVEATTALVKGCIAAAVAFAEAHPEIPRGAWRPRELAVV